MEFPRWLRSHLATNASYSSHPYSALLRIGDALHLFEHFHPRITNIRKTTDPLIKLECCRGASNDFTEDLTNPNRIVVTDSIKIFLRRHQLKWQAAEPEFGIRDLVPRGQL